MKHTKRKSRGQTARRRALAPRGRKQATAQASRERELKFHVPDEAVQALEREFAADRLLPLHAIYHDTQDSALRHASISLRIRREADRWVQTFKAPGAHAWERIEDNVDLRVAAGATVPSIDPARHRDAGVTQALRRAIGDEGTLAVLRPAFEVDVQRRTRQVEQGCSVIEVAFDQGEISAGGRTRRICELEFELVDGEESDLVALARQWCARWGLTLQAASKAARGYLLLSGDLYGPPANAPEIQVGRKPGAGEFSAAVLQSCLHQVVANADWVAAGSLSDEHVHQLRVGLRRLRTALRELPLLDTVRERHEPLLAGIFGALGERRDRGHVLRKIAPLVEAAGGSPLRVPAAFDKGADPTELVRQPAFQDALLDLLASAHRIRGEGGRGVRRAMRPRLAELHRSLVRDGRRFTQLPEERQHRARKRLKRLRYLSEFLAPLFGSDATHDYLATLKPAQDALGDYNDELMARTLYEELVGTDPGARFGVQWLRDRRAGRAKACRKALQKLEKAKPFWRKK